MFQKPLIKVGLKYCRNHLIQTFMLIIGISLGVAVVVAIDIANSSVNRSFQLSTESITGKTIHQIRGNHRGIDQSIYTNLRIKLGYRKSAPVITGYTHVKEFDNKTMQLLGIDPFAESGFRNYFNTQSNVTFNNPKNM